MKLLNPLAPTTFQEWFRLLVEPTAAVSRISPKIDCPGEKDIRAAASAPVTPPVGHTDGAGRRRSAARLCATGACLRPAPSGDATSCPSRDSDTPPATARMHDQPTHL